MHKKVVSSEMSFKKAFEFLFGPTTTMNMTLLQMCVFMLVFND